MSCGRRWRGGDDGRTGDGQIAAEIAVDADLQLFLFGQGKEAAAGCAHGLHAVFGDAVTRQIDEPDGFQITPEFFGDLFDRARIAREERRYVKDGYCREIATVLHKVTSHVFVNDVEARAWQCQRISCAVMTVGRSAPGVRRLSGVL